jgi:lipoyl(octanoyl) transferase
MLDNLEFDTLLRLQRRLLYDVSGGGSPSLILCELAPLVTIGREGSLMHANLEENQPDGKPWPIRWVNRGGGAWLHLPGQLMICPILPLQKLSLSLKDFLDRLEGAIRGLLAEFELPDVACGPSRTILAGSRPIACLGAAVRSWVTYHGAVLNINPSLELFRRVRTGEQHQPMTSLVRECRRPVRPGHVRQRLVEYFQTAFGVARSVLFMEHPLLAPETRRHALVAPR